MKQVLIVCGVVVATVAVAATSAFAYYTYRGKNSTKYIHIESEWQEPSKTRLSVNQVAKSQSMCLPRLQLIL